jgi:hypothetical protein
MSDIYTSFIKAIPSAAASPSALAAYVIAILCSTVVALRTRRHKMLLSKLEALPPAQRIRALELEIGTVMPRNLSPEQWLRSRIHTYVFMIVALVCSVALVITLVALTSKQAPPARASSESGVSGDIGLYQPPSGPSAAATPAPSVVPAAGTSK